MTPTPVKMNLKKDEKLDIVWSDGLSSSWSISTLRALGPCAMCKTVREQSNPHDLMKVEKKPLLTILPGNYAEKIVVTHAEKVGNYALKIVFSDGHDAGIYSWAYLRDISQPK